MSPEWLFWIWIVPIMVFSFIGQGIVSFLLIRLVYERWFAKPDSHDIEIKFLKEQIEDLISDKLELTTQNSKLVHMIVKNALPAGV